EQLPLRRYGIALARPRRECGRDPGGPAGARPRLRQLQLRRAARRPAQARTVAHTGEPIMTTTTDPSLRSFVPVAPESHFPIQNLPYGVFRIPEEERVRIGGYSLALDERRVGVAIGDFVLDLALLEGWGLLADPALGDRPVFRQQSLNAFL